MKCLKKVLNNLVYMFFLASTLAAGEQVTWTPEEVMKLKTIKDVQIAPNMRSALVVATEAIMTEDKDVYLSRIYTAALDGQENDFRLLTPLNLPATQPRWSPDGHWIAFLVEEGDKKNNLYLMDASGESMHALTKVNEDVQNFQWAHDSRHIAFVMADEISPPKVSSKFKNESYFYKTEKKINRLWMIDIHQSNQPPQPLTSFSYPVRGNGDFGTNNAEFDWSPDDKQIIFAYSAFPNMDSFYTTSSLATIDLDSGTIRPFGNQAQHESMPRYSPDGQTICYLSGNSPKIYAFNRDIFICSRNGNQRRKLAATFNEGPLLSGPNLLGWSHDGNDVIFFEPKGTNFQLVLLPKDGSPAKELAVKDMMFSEPAITYDGKALGFVGQFPDRPPEAYATLLQPFQPKQISHLNDHFSTFPPIKTEVIRWQAADGIEIEGLLTFPIGYQPGKRYPLLLIIHGGPMGVFNENFIGSPSSYPVASFAKAGFMILRPNPRGSSGYGKKFRGLNYGDWGGQDFQDLMAGVDQVIEKGLADSNRLGVMGWSYGGYMTAWTITHTNRFKAASMGAGISDLVSFAGTTDIPQFLPDYLGEFWINTQLYHQRSPIYYAAKVKTPCLIQHGLADKRVPVSQAYEFYEALERNNKQVALVLYPRMGHRFTEPKMNLDLMERNLKWFMEHLSE